MNANDSLGPQLAYFSGVFEDASEQGIIEARYDLLSTFHIILFMSTQNSIYRRIFLPRGNEIKESKKRGSKREILRWMLALAKTYFKIAFQRCIYIKN